MTSSNLLYFLNAPMKQQEHLAHVEEAAIRVRIEKVGPRSHEIWRHEQSGKKVTVPHHSGDMAEGTLRAILREAGINVNTFLNA